MRVSQTLRTQRKKCPNCWRDVSYRDTVCQYCGFVLKPGKIRRRKDVHI